MVYLVKQLNNSENMETCSNSRTNFNYLWKIIASCNFNNPISFSDQVYFLIRRT